MVSLIPRSPLSKAWLLAVTRQSKPTFFTESNLYKISNSIENFIEQGKKLNLQYKEPDNKENLKNEINNLIIDIIHEENNNPYTMMD